MYSNYPKAISWYKSAIYGGKVKLIHHDNKEIAVPGDPKLDEARRDLGFALLLNENSNESNETRQERYEDALDEFKEAIKVREENGESPNYSAYVGKGLAYYFLQDFDSAKSTLREVPEDDPYGNVAKRYLNKIDKCESSGQSKCVNYVSEINDIRNIDEFSILTSKDGISRMFGNVTVHEEELDQVLALEHAALYKGPCK
ncbi:MAG: tetratricopeptide repeat protein [Moorea sp. SIO2I5]|nr:tetratricopeptide repeat protein [Moorena sp. SIO2I5]